MQVETRQRVQRSRGRKVSMARWARGLGAGVLLLITYATVGGMTMETIGMLRGTVQAGVSLLAAAWLSKAWWY